MANPLVSIATKAGRGLGAATKGAAKGATLGGAGYALGSSGKNDPSNDTQYNPVSSLGMFGNTITNNSPGAAAPPPPLPKAATKLHKANESNASISTITKQLNVITSVLSDISNNIRAQYDLTRYQMQLNNRIQREQQLESKVNGASKNSGRYDAIKEGGGNLLKGAGSLAAIAGIAALAPILSSEIAGLVKSSFTTAKKEIISNKEALLGSAGIGAGVYGLSRAAPSLYNKLSPSKIPVSNTDAQGKWLQGFVSKTEALDKNGVIKPGYEAVQGKNGQVIYRKTRIVPTKSSKLSPYMSKGSSALKGMRLPGALSVGFEAYDYLAKNKKLTAANLTESAFAIGGGALGGALGGGVGSIFGPAGTAVGGIAGGIYGYDRGAAAGRKVSEWFGYSDAKPTQKESPTKKMPTEANAPGVGGTGSTKEAMEFFMRHGWSKLQAAGIVGNLQAESGPNLKINSVGDGGKAYGIAQWHPDRQRNFKEVFGKDIRKSGFKEQLQFIQWELNNTERKAGNLLKKATTAEQSASIIDKFYERSSGEHRQKRINNAKTLAGQNISVKTKPTTTASTGRLRVDIRPEPFRINPDIEKNVTPGLTFPGPSKSDVIKDLSRPDSVSTRNREIASTQSSPVIMPQRTISSVGTSDVPNPSAHNIVKEYQLYFTSGQ